MAAIIKLAQTVKPVTAESLRACQGQAERRPHRWPGVLRRLVLHTPGSGPRPLRNAHDTIRSYKRIAIWLAVFIIPLSMISFVCTGISNTITADLKIANDLAVKLHTQLDTPATPGSSRGTVAPRG